MKLRCGLNKGSRCCMTCIEWGSMCGMNVWPGGPSSDDSGIGVEWDEAARSTSNTVLRSALNNNNTTANDHVDSSQLAVVAVNMKKVGETKLIFRTTTTAGVARLRIGYAYGARPRVRSAIHQAAPNAWCCLGGGSVMGRPILLGRV